MHDTAASLADDRGTRPDPAAPDDGAGPVPQVSLRRLLDSLQAFVGLLDLDGRVLLANDAPLRASGLAWDDVRGRLFWDCAWWTYDDQARDRIRDACARAARGEDARFDIRYAAAGGRLRWLDFSIHGLRDDGGRVTHLVPSAIDIDDRRAASAHAERQAVLLDAVLESLPAGVAIAAPDGELTRWNRACAELWGLHALRPGDTADVDGYRAWKGWRHPAGEPLGARDWPMARALLERRRVEAELVSIERFDTGERRVAVIQAAPIETTSGELLGAVAVQSDVTAQIRLEQAVRDSETRLRTALEAANAGAFDWDPLTGHAVWSDGFYRLLGRAPGEVPATLDTWRAHLHPEDTALAEAALEQAVSSGGRLHLACRLLGADGIERHVVGRGLMVDTTDGCGPRCIGTLVDVTAQARIRQELEEAYALLDESAATADLGVYAYFPASGTVEWNDRLKRMWGFDPADAITLERMAGRVHPDDLGTFEAVLARGLDPGHGGRVVTSYRIVRPDGEVRWMRASGSTTFHAGRPYRMIGAVQDVTEQKVLELQLRDADRRKDVFLATLSHELRNPLAPIRTATELIGRPGLPVEQLHWAQGVLRRQVRHLGGLLDDLLDVSRITQGKLQLRIAPTPLAQIVEAAIETVQPAIDARRHTLVVDIPGDPVTVDGDPLRLAQVLANLLTNAVRYTDPQGRVTLRATALPGELVLQVQDTGIGLAPESLSRIFTMFSQVASADRRTDGGLGIGLALVKGLVELHGGRVSARSGGLGRGSTFEVRLPVPAKRPMSG